MFVILGVNWNWEVSVSLEILRVRRFVTGELGRKVVV